MVVSIAIDVDGPLVFAIGHGLTPEDVHGQMVLSSALRAEGPLPGRVVYGTEGERFTVRETDRFSQSSWDGTVAGHRVRVFDAVLRLQRQLVFRDIRVSLSTDFIPHLSGEAIEPADLWAQAVVRTPTPANVNVTGSLTLPRTLAAFVDWINDDAGIKQQDRASIPRTVLIDIGAQDTTIARFIGGDDVDQSFVPLSLGQGWIEVAERLSAGLQHEHGVGTVGASTLVQILASGTYRVRGQNVRADTVIAQAAGPLVESIAASLETIGPADAAVVVGLPALHAAAMLEQVAPCPVLTPDEPAFANARGLLKIASFAAADTEVAA